MKIYKSNKYPLGADLSDFDQSTTDNHLEDVNIVKKKKTTT